MTLVHTEESIFSSTMVEIIHQHCSYFVVAFEAQSDDIRRLRSCDPHQTISHLFSVFLIWSLGSKLHQRNPHSMFARYLHASAAALYFCTICCPHGRSASLSSAQRRFKASAWRCSRWWILRRRRM